MKDFDSIIPYGKVIHPSATAFKDFTKLVYSITQDEMKGDYGFVKVDSKDSPSERFFV